MDTNKARQTILAPHSAQELREAIDMCPESILGMDVALCNPALTPE